MKRRLIALCAVGAAAVVGLAAPAAQAASPAGTSPFTGDINSDGVPDRITLGSDQTGCTVTVEAGRWSGGYRAPEVHHYDIAGSQAPTYCPDLGTVLPSSSGPAELALTWFYGPPPGVTDAIDILKQYRVVDTIAGEFQPSAIGTQDFNGDGRADIWENTDQGYGFQTFLRQRDTYVSGPASFSTELGTEGITPQFGQLDGRPGTDIADVYYDPRNQVGVPASAGTGVIVVFGATGQKTVLETEPDGTRPPTVTLVNANQDRFLDVKVDDGVSKPRYYLNDGHGHFTLRH